MLTQEEVMEKCQAYKDSLNIINYINDRVEHIVSLLYKEIEVDPPIWFWDWGLTAFPIEDFNPNGFLKLEIELNQYSKFRKLLEEIPSAYLWTADEIIIKDIKGKINGL